MEEDKQTWAIIKDDDGNLISKKVNVFNIDGLYELRDGTSIHASC